MKAFITHQLEFVTRILDPLFESTIEAALLLESEFWAKTMREKKVYRMPVHPVTEVPSSYIYETHVKVEFVEKWLVSFYALGMATPYAIVVVEE